MARLLAIDYGKRRTGIAVTDPLKIIANPLATVETTQLLGFLLDYVKREEVERIVLGKPVQADGSPSENLARVEAFAGRWRKAMPTIPINYYDERFTSVLAHKAIISAGIGKKRRQTDKGLVDEISAAILLQDYMNSKQL